MTGTTDAAGDRRDTWGRLRRGSLFRLLAYTLTAWHLMLALIACIAVTALLELAVPWVMGFMLFDGVIKGGDTARLPRVVFALAAIFLGQKVFSFLREYLDELANQRIVHRLRCDLFEHVERLPLGSLDRSRTGDLQSRIASDVDSADGLLKTIVGDMASELIMFVGTIGFLWAVSPRLTLFVLPTVPALGLSVFFFKRTIKRSARAIRDLLGEMASHAGEAIAGARVVKAFCGERFEVERFASTSRALLRARVRIAKLQSVYSSTVDVWVFLGTVIVILVASPQVVAGTFTVGALVAYLSYLNKLYGPAKKLSKINVSIQKILAAGDRIFEVMDQPVETELEGVEVTDAPHEGWGAGGRADAAGAVGAAPAGARARAGGESGRMPSPAPISGAVRFERVSFGYGDGRCIIRDFDLDVRAGETVALVGHSGGGKTTVVSLLLRFYRPDAGRILLDGVPAGRIPLGELRRQIALVQQDTFLFSGTLRDNIAYACPAATDREIEEAARAAFAHDFITQLPGGYGAVVGERGVNLSGGQRQRIAIARALLRDPRILVFDEATSHLDSESEQLVQRALGNIARGRTVFVVAHRLSSLRHADKIVVIEEGSVVEAGTHADLLARDGLYRRLYQMQSSYEDAACGA